MPNPYANKIIYGGQVLIDLTSDTATAADVAQGKTFHDKSGASLTGTSTAITPTGTKNITDNGTYDVTNFASAAVAIPVYDGSVT